MNDSTIDQKDNASTSGPSTIENALPGPAQQVSEDPHYTDGAWRAWSTVAGAFLIQFYVVGVVNAFGVFQDFYTTEWLTNYSASAISWIGGVQYFFELGCAPIGGKIYDAGFGRASVLLGSFLCTLSFFTLSLAHPNQYYQVFLSQALGMGLALVLVFVPTMTMVSEHFKTRRSLAMSICAASSPLGAILFTPLFNHLFHSSVGFQWGVRCGAFITVGCFVLGNLLLRPPTRRSPSSRSDTPVAPLLDLPYLFILGSGFFWALGGQTPNFYLQLYVRGRIPNSLVFDTFAILSVGSIFGRIIPGWLADKWGPINVVIPSLVAFGGVSFAMFGAVNPAGFVIFTLLFGYFFGTMIALHLPLVASITPRGTNMGRRLGWALFPLGIASTVGPPLQGAILGPGFVWWRPIVVSSISILIAACLSFAARQILRRPNVHT